ncbi:MAG: hypothetical protein QOJ10_1843 [Chloroflexota bacterium]|jgi:hypothetical protein|nr:hypothetical protein [Chloroflexota bacterium]
MKRLVSSVVLAGGFLLFGIVNASASGYCSLDPTLSVGTPLTYSLNLSLSTSLVSTNVYASGTKKTTTFGGGVGIL